MNTPDENQLHRRISTMDDVGLLRTIQLFDLGRQLDIDLASMVRTVWPEQAALELPASVLASIPDLLRAELKRRVMKKGGRQP